MERQQDTHVSSACKIIALELMRKYIQGYKEIKLKLTIINFSIPRGVLFLSYSQSKQAISDRAHEGALEFQRGFISGRMRAHRKSMG